MTATVQSMVATTYVRDIAVSRTFYGLLGFEEQSSGQATASGWSSLVQGDLSVVLASTEPPLDIPRLPLLFYFYVDDLDAVIGRLGAAGVEVLRVGYPPHALGGEARLVDPDGNTILLGQRDRSASQAPADDDDATPRFSLLKEAAAMVAAQGESRGACQVGHADGTPCPNQAEVKLADAWGDSTWACLDHADEILVTVRSTFIANHDQRSLAAFLARRHAH